MVPIFKQFWKMNFVTSTEWHLSDITLYNDILRVLQMGYVE